MISLTFFSVFLAVCSTKAPNFLKVAEFPETDDEFVLSQMLFGQCVFKKNLLLDHMQVMSSLSNRMKVIKAVTKSSPEDAPVVSR